MLRILLFLAANIAVALILGIVMEVFGLYDILDRQGLNIDLDALPIMSAVVGAKL